MTTFEKVARALCTYDDLAPSTKFEGKPMWHSYLPQVMQVFIALRQQPPAGVDATAWLGMIDAAVMEADEL